MHDSTDSTYSISTTQIYHTIQKCYLHSLYRTDTLYLSKAGFSKEKEKGNFAQNFYCVVVESGAKQEKQKEILLFHKVTSATTSA